MKQGIGIRLLGDAHQRVISLVTEIVSEVPVYLLACTPDERAVTLLKQTLEGEPK